MTYLKIPIFIFLSCVIAEWLFVAFPPNSFFYTRGDTSPNLDYETVTVGDLAYRNIITVPVERKCRYITDKFGGRNNFYQKKVDAVFDGDSFTWGAGNSHEYLPAVQFMKKTKLTSYTLPSHHYPLNQFDVFARAAFIMKYRFPVDTGNLFIFLHDGILWEPPYPQDPVIKINEIMKSDSPKKYLKKDIRTTFAELKSWIDGYSPMKITSRKFQTFLIMKREALVCSANRYFVDNSRLTRMMALVFNNMSWGNCYSGDNIGINHVNGVLYRFVVYPPDNVDLKEIKNTRKYKQILAAIIELNRIAKQENINFVTVLIPRKTVAYKNHLKQYFELEAIPSKILHEDLIKRKCLSIYTHNRIFKAVENQIQNDGPYVYWPDDTHWAPYGIEVAVDYMIEQLTSANQITP